MYDWEMKEKKYGKRKFLYFFWKYEHDKKDLNHYEIKNSLNVIKSKRKRNSNITGGLKGKMK